MTPRQGTNIARCSFHLLHEISLSTERVSQQKLTHHLGHIGTHGHGLSINAGIRAIIVKMLRPGQVFLAFLAVHPHLLRNAVAVNPTNSEVIPQQVHHVVNVFQVFSVM
jgi:hypothetical protein